MIVRQEGNFLEFYRQIDHAAAAAELVGHIEPRYNSKSVIAETIRLHDAAWEVVDESPTVLPDGTPRDFLNMPAETATSIWNRSIRLVHDQLGPLSSLATSRHFSRMARASIASGARSPEDESSFKAFLDHQSQLQERWRGDPSASVQATDELVALLRLFDTITVYMLSSADSHAEMRTSDMEFRMDGKAPTNLRFTWRADRRLEIQPWIFATASISIEIPCRILPLRKFSDDAELRASLRNAPESVFSYIISSSDSMNGSQGSRWVGNDVRVEIEE